MVPKLDDNSYPVVSKCDHQNQQGEFLNEKFLAQVYKDYGNIYFEELISSFSSSKHGSIFIINIVHDNSNQQKGKTTNKPYSHWKLILFLMTSLFQQLLMHRNICTSFYANRILYIVFKKIRDNFKITKSFVWQCVYPRYKILKL